MSKKLVPLEGQRGVAAIIVVVHHFILAFHPSVSGILPDTRTTSSLAGSPLFALINGYGAVIFFFTLSGFVLSWGYFHNPRPQKLLWDALKRWPRLAGPVVITCIASAILFQTGSYFYRDAGIISGSYWMQTFGYSPFHETVPSLATSIWQGVTTFLSGQTSMNTSLWTMVYEYYGSLIVFALCPLMMKLNSRLLFPLVLALVALSTIPGGYPSPIANLGLTFVAPFLVGMSVSFLYSRPYLLRFSFGTSAALIAFGLYLLSYYEPLDYYFWASPIANLSPQAASSVIYSVGAGAVICGTICNDRVFRSMDNAIMRSLGRLSFPLYLVHMLVLGSASSWLYLNAIPAGGVLLFAATFSICLALAIPFAFFDEWWVKAVRVAFSKLEKITTSIAFAFIKA